MVPQTNKLKQRTIERFFMLLVSLVLALLFLNVYNTLQNDFETVPQRLNQGTTVNLNAANAASKLKTLLQSGYYFEDKRDIGLITTVVEQGLNKHGDALDNIGELNKKDFYVDA